MIIIKEILSDTVLFLLLADGIGDIGHCKHTENVGLYGSRKEIEIYMQSRRYAYLYKDRQKAVIKSHHYRSRKNICKKTKGQRYWHRKIPDQVDRQPEGPGLHQPLQHPFGFLPFEFVKGDQAEGDYT